MRCLLLVGLLALLCGVPRFLAVADDDEKEDVLVRVGVGVDANSLAADYETTVDDHVDGTDTYALRVPAGTTQQAFVEQLSADPRIVFAETEALVESPEFSGNQMHLAFDGGRAPGKYNNQIAYRQVDLGKALSITRGAGVVVAVLDTGVALRHPALLRHLTQGFSAINPAAPPAETPDGTTNVAMGHGTMVAGLIARLAPDAKIMPVRVLNGDGTGTLMTVVQGIHYAVAHGARVLNLSLGSAQPSEALKEAIEAATGAGVVVVAAAGNDGAELPHYPAAFEGVLGIASVEANNRKSPYSNYGEFVSGVAPGSGIRSTFWDGGYATWSGTSFAAPFVSAEAALVLSANPRLLADTADEDIRETARSVSSANPSLVEKLGAGIIDVQAGVRRARRGQHP